LPDFLLIGAAKAGTTALFRAISRHPQIFCSSIKEPRFFAFEGDAPRFTCPVSAAYLSKHVGSLSDYQALFSSCPPEMRSGEASTYLSYPSAPQKAARHVPQARLIAILRHPVERAFSQWLHLLHEGKEPCDDFESAWMAEAERMARGWAPLYQYRDRGFYGQALERWLQFFPREQLLILFYEDWLEKPAACLELVCRHLGVDILENPLVTKENVSSRQPRWPWLHHRMQEDNVLRRAAQRLLPLAVRVAITKPLQSLNLVPGPRLDRALRSKLASTFDDDLSTVESIAGRELGAWRS